MIRLVAVDPVIVSVVEQEIQKRIRHLKLNAVRWERPELLGRVGFLERFLDALRSGEEVKEPTLQAWMVAKERAKLDARPVVENLERGQRYDIEYMDRLLSGEYLGSDGRRSMLMFLVDTIVGPMQYSVDTTKGPKFRPATNPQSV